MAPEVHLVSIPPAPRRRPRPRASCTPCLSRAIPCSLTSGRADDQSPLDGALNQQQLSHLQVMTRRPLPLLASPHFSRSLVTSLSLSWSSSKRNSVDASCALDSDRTLVDLPAICSRSAPPPAKQQLAKSPWLQIHAAGRDVAMDLAGMEPPGHATPRPGLAGLFSLAAPPHLQPASPATTTEPLVSEFQCSVSVMVISCLSQFLLSLAVPHMGL